MTFVSAHTTRCMESSGVIHGPPQGQPYGVHCSVGAIRGRRDSGGLNIVSRMPSGLKSRVSMNTSNGIPDTTSMISRVIARHTRDARRRVDREPSFADDCSGGQTYVVDNDGLHGPKEVSGYVALSAGLHPITVAMFQATGGLELDVAWSGPGIARERVPAGALGRRAPSAAAGRRRGDTGQTVTAPDSRRGAS